MKLSNELMNFIGLCLIGLMVGSSGFMVQVGSYLKGLC